MSSLPEETAAGLIRASEGTSVVPKVRIVLIFFSFITLKYEHTFDQFQI